MFQLRLKELREKAGYSQYSFAEAFGVAQSTVGSWEAGSKEPRNYDTTKRLADFFKVSVDYLIGNSDEVNLKREITLEEGLEFAFLQGYKALDDEDRAELNRMKDRMLELKHLKSNTHNN